MLEINTPLVLANKVKYKLVGFSMSKLNSGKFAGNITVQLLDENNKRVTDKLIAIPAEEWNTFWNNFNSGTYLYQLVKTKLNLSAEVVEVEAEFLN